MPDLEMYRLAEEFKAEKLWDRLCDSDIFAVRLADGETAWCSVMGMNGEYFALGVYVGAKGFSSLDRLMSRGGDMPSLRDMLSQDCLMCSLEDREEIERRDYAEIKALGLSYRGRNAWPRFRRHKPYKMSWFIEDEGECEALKLALRAAVAVSRKLRELPPGSGAEALGYGENSCPLLIPTDAENGGFLWEKTELPKGQIPGIQPRLTNDLEVARLKKMKTRRGERLLLDMMLSPMPVDGEPAYFPETLFMLLPDGTARAAAFADDFDEDAQEIFGAFLDYIDQEGKPEFILVRDARLYLLLSGVAEQIGIALELREKIPEFEEIELELQDFLASFEEEADEEEMSARLTLPPENRHPDAQGVCALCGKEFKKTGMLRHLEACAARDRKSGGETYFILKVEDVYRPEYFLFIEVSASASLSVVDAFLRDIWVECCGHMSAFMINGYMYSSHADPGEQSMRVKIATILCEGTTFHYEYDFGSTTELMLTVSKSFTAVQRKDKTRLLARNSPPQITCLTCGKPATTVCAYCDGLSAPYCDECGPKHECGDEALMPLVNSPRCGVCGYGME